MEQAGKVKLNRNFIDLKNLRFVINVTVFTVFLVASLHPHSKGNMLEIIGYFASALIGISLGLIGGGGSILTVPVLVYLFHTDAVLATSYSLFIVGTTSLVGALPKLNKG